MGLEIFNNNYSARIENTNFDNQSKSAEIRFENNGLIPLGESKEPKPTLSNFFEKREKSDAKSPIKDVIQRAYQEVGVRESTGNNDGKQIEKYRYRNRSYNNLEWCASFVNWLYNPEHKSGQNLFGLSDRHVLGSQRIYHAAVKNNCFIPAKGGKPKAGDIIIWKSKTDSGKGHVGIVTEVRPNGSFVTVQGNSHDAVEKIEYQSVKDAINLSYESSTLTLLGFARPEKYYNQRK